MKRWRTYVAHVGAYLKMSVQEVIYWDDLLLWNHEAKRIHAESYGLIASLLRK